MAQVVLAPALTRWLPPDQRPSGELRMQAAGADVDAALRTVFQHYPVLRGYVLDEHAAVRHHVAIFIDGEPMRDKRDLRQPVEDASEIYVMQALSGG